ncbi:MAG: hypothetical protein QXN24_08175 [Candidatus Bathyarchaeia archaeon]
MRKSIVFGMAVAAFFIVTLLSSAQIALSEEPAIRVIVHAMAKDSDIIVGGKVFLKGLEDGREVDVTITITVKKPGNTSICETFCVEGVTQYKGVTKILFEHIFEGCVNEKGIYEIEVTATCGGLVDTAFFKFDPPTGGTPGVPC